MKLSGINLTNFRSHRKASWEFGEKTIIVGANGSGKSNILEAIYLLAVGKSFRAQTEMEMITYGEKVATVEATVDGEEPGMVKVILTDGSVGEGRKKFEINGVPKRMVDAVGRVRATMFGPGDMELVTGSPSGRRRYLDFVLGQKEREYRRNLISYEKGLRQRNKLLDKIRDGMAGRNQLWFWDRLLVKNGEYITEKREKYLEQLNNQGQLAGDRQTIFRTIYDRSVISEDRLAQYEREEVAAGSTLVGPHRDDFIITQTSITSFQFSNNDQLPITNTFKDVSKYGSRGEQRMAVLWLKTGELAHLSDGPEVLPILLLDDVFSELDHEHRDRVMQIAQAQSEAGGQVIMTCADTHLVPDGRDWRRVQLGG